MAKKRVGFTVPTHKSIVWHTQSWVKRNRISPMVSRYFSQTTHKKVPFDGGTPSFFTLTPFKSGQPTQKKLLFDGGTPSFFLLWHHSNSLYAHSKNPFCVSAKGSRTHFSLCATQKSVQKNWNSIQKMNEKFSAFVPRKTNMLQRI